MSCSFSPLTLVCVVFTTFLGMFLPVCTAQCSAEYPVPRVLSRFPVWTSSLLLIKVVLTSSSFFLGLFLFVWIFEYTCIKWVHCLWRPDEGVRAPGSGIADTVWRLRTRFRFFARTANSFNHRAIPLSPTSLNLCRLLDWQTADYLSLSLLQCSLKTRQRRPPPFFFSS